MPSVIVRLPMTLGVGDIILTQLACPLSDIMFSLDQEYATYLNVYRGIGELLSFVYCLVGWHGSAANCPRVTPFWPSWPAPWMTTCFV